MQSRYQPKSIKKPRWRLPILAAAFLVIILATTGAVVYMKHTEIGVPATKTTGRQAVSQPDAHAHTIRLVATGDWIAHDSINSAAKQADGTYNYLPLVDDTAPVFQDADIRFCNDPILNGGESLGVTGYPKFNSPTEFVTDMGKIGCNLVNTASNHSFDFTQTNITNSVTAWASVPNTLAVAGENRSQAEHDTVHYFTIKGVKFAFLAYTTYINTDAPVQNDYGVSIFSQGFAASQIAEAKQNGAQYIIASMRWGTEYSNDLNSSQQQDAQFLADQGVNLILGHGTHELQPVQELTGQSGNKTVVWYGLGNFLNTQEPPETLFNGFAVIDIDTQSLAVTNMRYLPIYMHYSWTPAQAAADNIAARQDVHLYLFQDATQDLIDAQQLKTTLAAQDTRFNTTLSTFGLTIPLITLAQYQQTY